VRGLQDGLRSGSGLSVDQFELGQAQQIAGMIDALGRTLLRDLVVFPKEGW
jgi:hypothetical protein